MAMVIFITLLPSLNYWRIDMTKEKLLEKAREFEKKNKSFTWKPIDFPEDMTEENKIGRAHV